MSENVLIASTSDPSEVVDTALPQLQETAEVMVDMIDDKGDILDRLKSIRKVAGVGTLATGAAITGLAEGIGYGDSFHLPGVAILAVTTIAATELHRKVQHRFERQRVGQYRQLQKELSGHFDGETVEIHRERASRHKKSEPLVLKWDGNPDTDEPLTEYVAGRLRQLQSVAKAADIERVAIPASYVEEYSSELGMVETQDEWFADFKRMKIKDPIQGKREFLFVDQDELNEVIGRVESSIETEEPMRSIMRVLKQYFPNHQAHNWYDQRKANEQLSQKKMKAIFKGSLERNLTEFYGSVEVTEDFDYIRHRSSSGGTLVPSSNENPKIRWLQPGKQLQDVATDLFSHEKITMADLEQVLEHPESYPAPKVKALCELAGWMLLEGYDVQINGDGNDKNGLNGQEKIDHITAKHAVPGVQERLAIQARGSQAERRRLKQEQIAVNDTNMFLRRIGRAITMTAFAAGTAFLAARTAESINIKKDNVIKQQMHDEGKDQAGYHGKDEPEYYRRRAEDPFQNAFDYVTNPFYRYEIGVYDVVDKLFHGSDAVSSYDEQNKIDAEGLDFSGDMDCLTCRAPVGNAPDGPNKPVWYLKSFGGIEASGYWSQSTYDETYPIESVKWASFTPEYSPEDSHDPADKGKLSPVIQESIQLPLASTTSSDGQAIRVQRNISLGSGGLGEPGYKDYKYATDKTGTYRVIPIPVLNGTKVAYATLGENQPVRLYKTENNLSLLLIPDNDKRPQHDLEKLEYWLVPDPGSKGPSMKSRLDAEVYETKTTDKYYAASREMIGRLEQEEQGIQAAWDKAIPNLPSDPKQREQAEEDYLRNNFTYNLAPLNNEDQKSLDHQSKYAETVLRIKQGNCNIVGSLLAISNPTELNYVVGFNNGAGRPDGTGYLSINEAHAWTVDKDAKIHDATPGGGKTADTSENFDDTSPADQKDDDRKKQEMIGLGLLGAVGLAAFINRRRLKTAKVVTQRKVATRRLDKTGDKDIHIAATTLDYASFAPDSESLGDALMAKAVTRDNGLQIIEDHSNSSYKTAKKSLRRVKTSSRAERKAKRLAKNLVKAEVRANRQTPAELQRTGE